MIAQSVTELPAGDRLWRLLCLLGSLKLTLVILAALGAGVLVAYQSETRTTWALVGPLLAFAFNLAAAVLTNAVFRRQTALLVFHLALIAIVLLVAAGRLTYLKAAAVVTGGETFDGQLIRQEAGPWHPWHLERVAFMNEGFEVEYAPGLQRGATRNRVSWTDSAGRRRTGIVGDHSPLVIEGYRFYTTSNKGFAPVFLWRPERGEPMLGSVHLPSFPLNEFSQAVEWTPPGAAREIWMQLRLDEEVVRHDAPWVLRLPQPHRIVARIGEARHELRLGDTLHLEGGTLTYDGLSSWMGYTVYYDRTIHWLLAACVVAVGSLGWHLWRKYFSRPWLSEPDATGQERSGGA